ncbi:MAG: aldo/keto reductase [Actinobacteria bacterium]|nr:aldo/keto reductase [Actinomycetota bacterium]
MPMPPSSVTIAPGVEAPRLAFGTYRIPPGDPTYEAVGVALEAGYRHIDTAAMYGNEAGVGRAIRQHGDDGVFVTTKVAREDVGRDRVRRSVEASLELLGVDQVDLVLLHWPEPPARVQSYASLLEAQESGLIWAAGVSNFVERHLDELEEAGLALPAVNQIELHPFVFGSRRDLVQRCEADGMTVSAYSPLARGERLGHPLVQQVADKHGLTPAQVHIAWALQHGWITIPKSSNPERIRENALAGEAELTAEDLRRLDDLDENLTVAWDPEGAA